MRYYHLFIVTTLLFYTSVASTQTQLIAKPDSVLIDGIPKIDVYKKLDEIRPQPGIFGISWHPTKMEMAANSRPTSVQQVYYIKGPGMDRRQLTFSRNDRAWTEGFYRDGSLLLYSMGNQLYRLQLSCLKSEALTISDNNRNVKWNKSQTKILYIRNNDVWLMDPKDTTTAQQLFHFSNNGWWTISDWSDDQQKILLNQDWRGVGMFAWLYDNNNKTLTKITSLDTARNWFGQPKFALQNKGMFFISDGVNFLDFSTGKIFPLSQSISGLNQGGWTFALSPNRKKLAFVATKDFQQKVYVLNTATNQYHILQSIPSTNVLQLNWHNDNNTLGIMFQNVSTYYETYSYNLKENKLVRWTETSYPKDTSVIPAFKAIKWKTFDEKELTGVMIYPKFRKTKLPVVIYVDRGGIGAGYTELDEPYAKIFPVLRGVEGFGEVFADLDNGVKKLDAVKDMGTLLDWISHQPELDANRILIVGKRWNSVTALLTGYYYPDKVSAVYVEDVIPNINTFLKRLSPDLLQSEIREYGPLNDTMINFHEKTALINNTEKLKVPVFIVQGKNSPETPLEEVVSYVQKLRQNEIPVWFMTGLNEGRYFFKPENQEYRDALFKEFRKRYLLN